MVVRQNYTKYQEPPSYMLLLRRLSTGQSRGICLTSLIYDDSPINEAQCLKLNRLTAHACPDNLDDFEQLKRLR